MEGRRPFDFAFVPRPWVARRLIGLAIWWPVAIVAGCGGVGFIGTTASSFLRHVRETNDPNVRYQAIANLADPDVYENEAQQLEAVRHLSEALASGKELVATRAEICRTLGDLGRPEARTALRKAVLDENPLVRAQACRALGKVGTTEDATILVRMMTTDLSRDCRVAAIEALGTLKPDDRRIELKLVEGMRNPDPAIRAASYAALKEVTGQDLGLDVEPWQKLVQSRLEAAPSRQ